MNRHAGHVFWLFGLSGAGKSSLAASLIGELRSAGRPVLPLDGDVLRAGLCQGLGFSESDRAENLRRAAEVAKLGLREGFCVVASFITPRAAHRNLVTDIIGRDHLSLVFVDTPLAICHQRDPKGLYAAAAAGRLADLTGISSTFDRPNQSDLEIATSEETLAESAAKLIRFARHRLTLAD